MKWILFKEQKLLCEEELLGHFHEKNFIIGNSHVGSLKRAWDGMRSTYDMDVELSFIATRGQGLLNAHIKNGVLSLKMIHMLKETRSYFWA